MNMTKPAAIALEIGGGALSLGALVRLFSRLSFGAMVTLAIGLCFLWAGRRLIKSSS
jgi:hypothetical protein